MNTMKTTVALLVGCTVSTLACNGSPSSDPDCQNPDLGSCGMACCKLEFAFSSASPESVHAALVTAVGGGGPDGRYSWQTTAEGTFGTFKLPEATYPYLYVGQAHHTTPFPDGTMVTSGPYTDTVNFAIYQDAARGNQTTLRGFSLSLINGALGDNGINYKSLLQVARQIKVVNSTLDWDMRHPDGSCPAK
ncbi:hypothetical protein DIPPA_01797 [Diplonema papillatum]|nr:hypothetical protein DIPPA_01797 [Diplonema papillatum]